MAKAAKAPAKKAAKLTKAGLITALTDSIGEGSSRKNVVAVLDKVTEVAYSELKKSGSFVFPGFAKFVVATRPAKPARDGINPFTKAPTTFAAKPASKTAKARPVKALKDAIK